MLDEDRVGKVGLARVCMVTVHTNLLVLCFLRVGELLAGLSQDTRHRRPNEAGELSLVNSRGDWELHSVNSIKYLGMVIDLNRLHYGLLS